MSDKTTPMNLLEPPIRSKLRRLATAIRARLAGEGLAWLLLAAVGAVFATLALDYYLNLPRALRAAFALAALVAVACVVFKQIILPLAAPLDSENLALLVERRFGLLKDRLISAIQFGRMDLLQGQTHSPAMVLRVAREANDLAARLDFRQIVERRTMWRMLGLAGSGLMLLAGFALWQPAIMGLYFQRDLLMREVPWPQRNYLRLPAQDFEVLREDDLKVTIEADTADGHVAPSQITVHIDDPSVGQTTESRIGQTAPSSGQYVATFPGVVKPFTFYVTGGDDRHDAERPHAVRVIDPPALMDASFQVYYHDYVAHAPETFDGSHGGLSARVGSTVIVTARANKDLAQAVLSYNGKDVAMQVAQTPSDKGQLQPRLVKGKFSVGSDNKSPGGVLVIRLRDTEGYGNRRPQQYLVQLVPDLPPTVTLQKRGVGSRITVRALLPLLIAAKDDCGLASIVPVVTGVRKSQAASASTSAGAALPAIDGPRPALATASREYAGRADVDITPMGLKPGDTVSVSVLCRDNLPPEFGGPNAGASGTISFDVVRDEDLIEEIIARQRSARMDFMQALKLQEDARIRTASGAAAAAAQVGAEARQHLADSSRLETDVSADCAKAATALEAILEEMTNNKLGTPEEHATMRHDVIEALQSVQEALGKQVTALGAASGTSDVTEFRRQAMAIVEAQQDISRRMEAIVQRMQKIESRADIASQVDVMIRWSQELLDNIKKLQNQDIEQEFAPKVKEKPKP